MRRKMQVVVMKVNLIRPVCNHMLGHDHTFIHRLIVGVVVMFVGVVIAKTVGHAHNQLVAIGGDVLGYGLHGFGLTPIIEELVSNYVD